MMEIIKNSERGHFDHGWLKTWHSFSFAGYYNPKRMNFGALRVVNEDIIAPGEGFPPHSHNNMEIVTIILSGQLEHKDSSGGHGIIKEGFVQHMSAGSGVRHSEFNASKKDPCHLLQLWIDTKEKNIKPAYGDKNFEWTTQSGLVKIASGKKNEGLYIHQDAAIFIGKISKPIVHKPEHNGVYILLIDGEATVNGEKLSKGDSAQITGAKEIKIKPAKASRILLIEVPLA